MVSNILTCLVLSILVSVAIARPSTEQSVLAHRLHKLEEMRKYMNESADPCEDFYEFTCGNWNTYHPAAATRFSSTSFMDNLIEDLENKIKLMLVTDDAADTDTDKKVKDYYRSCLNLPSQKKVYRDKLKEIIGEFGQMPALVGDSWREEDFDWLKTVSDIGHKYGVTVITRAAVMVDFADNSVNRLYMDLQELALPDKSLYLDKDFLTKQIHRLALTLNESLGIEGNLALKTAQEIIEFETYLAEGEATTVQGKASITLSTLDEIQDKYSPDLDFKKLVTLCLGTIPKLKVYFNEKYTEHLIKTLKVTPKRMVANYIFFKLINKFQLAVEDTEEMQANTCFGELKKFFSKNFDSMVYRKYISKDTEQGVNFVWQNIKSTFKAALESEQYKWIKADTRKYALEKLNAMKMEIVSYQDYDFASEFGALSVDSKDYVANLRSIYTLIAIQERDSINAPPKRIDVSELVSTTPVYIRENVVLVPVAVLQPYYVLSAAFPNSVNFGMFGTLLAHELVHGFDDDGRNQDVRGKSLKWWDEDSYNDFNDRSKCFNEQYQGFIFHGRHLADRPSQSENIADNGGVRLAYNTYVKWLDSISNGHVELIPDWNYNSKQMFFMSYGSMWCADRHPGYSKILEVTDKHSPSNFRVIGPLANFEEFSKEFHCPKGSGMNPTKKCEIY